MSASSLSLPIFLRINFLISYLIVTDSQNTFDWHTQRALLNDKKAGAGCTSRAFKHPGRDVTAPDVWPSILTDYTYDSELDNADGVPLAFRRSSMFPEGNTFPQQGSISQIIWYELCTKVKCLSLGVCTKLIIYADNLQKIILTPLKEIGTAWLQMINYFLIMKLINNIKISCLF